MSEDQVAIWVESYPICAHVTLAIESMYSADDEMKEEKGKEEGEKRRILDTDDRHRGYEELRKHSHPLKLTSSGLYNIINGKVANASVNVQETLKMGESMLLDFRSSLPGGFHAPLKRKFKTMECIKCGVAIGDKTLYDMASLFCRLITVGQHWQVELQTLFDYELCAVPASIIDEYGCLRTGTKSTLVSKLPPTDANLSYHILRAHYQVMLWKAADQQTPPAVDITAYGWVGDGQWCTVCANSTHCKRTSSSSCPHGRHQLPVQSCRESLQQSCM